MRAVVIGGTGRIGSRVVARLRDAGHDATAASPDTGVDTVTGEGLAEVLEGADVVVDVSNSPSLEGGAALAFFTASTKNLLQAEEAAGVRHHVALSVVGTERLSEGGYFAAKLAQEGLIAEGPVPYSIVHATQFFEFLRGIAEAATEDGTARVAPVLIQPMAADDVASAVARVAVGAPANAIVEIAGPERFRMDELVRRYLDAQGDPRPVVTDPDAAYFGIRVDERTLLPDEDAATGPVRFEDWVRASAG
ncbi:MAG TPA: SDR family oxidoreductase, partial [Longimicrobiales bacterium]|nr:SDR family oxidoreductase [Longimicrobiales bacterium]